MICAWKELLAVVPVRMRREVDKYGQESMQELRLRLGLPPELILAGDTVSLDTLVTREDIHFSVNAASAYSPWAAASIAKGYLSIPGGHRMGLCGETVMKGQIMEGIRTVTSLCIRVARDIPGIAADRRLRTGSVLILGPPGSGKTTFLRDLIRRRSESGPGSVAVVDERGELFPVNGCFSTGSRTDIMTGCSKAEGMEALLRCMGPACIAVDEITAQSDCTSLVLAAGCGVDLLATAHAGGKKDLLTRPVYRMLVKNHIFQTLVTMRPDKSWILERMEL